GAGVGAALRQRRGPASRHREPPAPGPGAVSGRGTDRPRHRVPHRRDDPREAHLGAEPGSAVRHRGGGRASHARRRAAHGGCGHLGGPRGSEADCHRCQGCAAEGRRHRRATHAERDAPGAPAPEPVGQSARELGRQRPCIEGTGTRMTRSPRRTELTLGYVLHHRPWRDTRRILEVLTREHGRLTLFARGVRGPRAKLAPVLQPFQPLLLSWSGRGEAPQLPAAGGAGGGGALAAAVALAAFYRNELVMKLTTRHDPLPALFDHYHATLGALRGGAALEPILRIFEK